MKIGIVGNGAVGRTTAEGFRSKGHDVYVNDVRCSAEEKIYSKRTLMRVCDLVFVCVPTPPKPDESLDTSIVEQAVKELDEARSKANKPVLVIRSTVAPGMTLRLSHVYPQFEFASNPEFLRMKTALNDFLCPDRIVIGATSRETAKKVAHAYKGWDCPILITDLNTAETIKLVANSFLAYKVAFSCDVANFCRILGLNAKEVMDAVCLDPRIGPSHMDPSKGAIPKNDHCLPKDMSGLIRFLEDNGYDSKLLRAAYDVGVCKE